MFPSPPTVQVAETTQADLQRRALIFLVLGVVSIGFSPIIVVWAAAPGPVLGVYRMGIAGIVLTLPMLQRQRQTRTISKATVLLPLVAGLLFAGDVALWNTAINFSGATDPTLMGNMAPLWVALGPPISFESDSVEPFGWACSPPWLEPSSILGADALRDISIGWGSFLGLLAGTFYAGYLLVTQKGRQQLDVVSFMWIMSWASALGLGLMTLIWQQPLLGYSWTQYAAMLASGLVVQVVGQFLIGYALGYLPASSSPPLACYSRYSVESWLCFCWGNRFPSGKLLGEVPCCWECLWCSAAAGKW